MAIEVNQIHNVVRTYQQALHLPPSVREDAEQGRPMKEDQISISSVARDRENYSSTK
jgi:hypothetical protein